MDDAPLFRVIRGTPTPAELAALVGAVLSRSRPAAAAPTTGATAWVRSARPGAYLAAGRPAGPGRDAWRAAARPH